MATIRKRGDLQLEVRVRRKGWPEMGSMGWMPTCRVSPTNQS